jgi:4-hydroxythreonine-4-phosphate dehydrogenase
VTQARPCIAITSGEPAGIGPELCAALTGRREIARLVVLGDAGLMAERARCAGSAIAIHAYRRDAEEPDDGIEVLHVPLRAPSVAGRLDVANAPYVLELLDRARAGCVAGEFDAMVTAPVHKGIINDAGIAFSGHTEYLADTTATPRVVMMLAGRTAGHDSTTGRWLRVALATTHLPLAAVPAAITRESLTQTLRILHAALRSRFGIGRPHILVAGLNPHAGEGGHLGREEIEVITPVLDALRAEGMWLDGPLPADTLFVPRLLADADAVLAMYHDQGLPVLKYATFGRGINITLGLPIIRTSVDHGTALDLAGTGRADAGSLIEAIDAAIAMAHG